jgi:hypothetical protein
LDLISLWYCKIMVSLFGHCKAIYQTPIYLKHLISWLQAG